MKYESYGEYELKHSEGERQKIFRDVVALRRERKDILEGNRRFYDESRKMQRLYEIDKRLLELDYKDSIQFNYGRIATRNLAHKEKAIKIGSANIIDCVKSINNNDIVIGNVNAINNNPLVTGDISKVYKDTEDIRILFEIANILGRNKKRLEQMDPQTQKILDIIKEVSREYDKNISKIQMDLDHLVEQIEVYTDRKKVGGRSEFDNYVRSLKALTADNRMKARDSVYEDAKKELDKVDVIDKTQKRIAALPKKTIINKSIINSNLKTAELVQFIGLVVKQLRGFRFTPIKKSYGGYIVDLSSSIEKCKKAIEKLETLKEKLTAELEMNGYSKEIESMNTQIKYGEVTNTLAAKYVTLETKYGFERKEIENDIENVLINSNIPQDMWSSIKYEAQAMARQRLEIKEFEKSSKFHEAQKREEKQVAIAHRELISNHEITEIEREARREADIRFKEEYQYKSGDVHDLNDSERERFIEKYVNDKIEQIVSSRYEDKQREARVEEKAFVDYTETMKNEGLSEEMLSFASEILSRDGKLEDTDLTKLKPSEVKEVVDYAKKMKGYVGLSDMELAEAMLKDSKAPGEKISKEELLVQYNLNQHRGISNRLNHLFTQDIKVK